MAKLLAALGLVLAFVGAPAPAAPAAAACSAFLAAPGPIPTWLEPGAVLCLHAGTYPHDTLRLTANSATYQGAPGEPRPRLLGSAPIEVYGHDVTLADLELDGGGAGLPVVELRGPGATLRAVEVHHGAYNGIDVWASGAVLTADTIHDLQPDNQIPGNDAQCINVHPGASFGLLISSAIFDCWGDGIQFFGLLPTPITQAVSSGWVISGNDFHRGTLPYSENAIDIKQGAGFTISGNDIGGYSNAGRLGTSQPAVVLHGAVSGALFSANNVHDSYEGVQLSNGRWLSLTISANTFRRLSLYTLGMAAARGAIVQGNTIVSGGSEVIQVSSSGWTGGSFDNNRIESSGAPRLYAGAAWSGVALGPNTWLNSPAGFLASASDATPTPPPTATAVPSATASPSPTPTNSPTPTATATAWPSATPTLSGCWDLRARAPLSIPCP